VSVGLVPATPRFIEPNLARKTDHRASSLRDEDSGGSRPPTACGANRSPSCWTVVLDSPALEKGMQALQGTYASSAVASRLPRSREWHPQGNSDFTGLGGIGSDISALDRRDSEPVG